MYLKIHLLYAWGTEEIRTSIKQNQRTKPNTPFSFILKKYSPAKDNYRKKKKK